MRKIYLFVSVIFFVCVCNVRAGEIKISDVVKSATLSGDLLLRHEDLTRERGGSDYNRERFRLRLGLSLELPEYFYAYIRLGSATPGSNGGDQASEMQTESFVSGQKSVWIDRAYMEWRGLKVGDADIAFLGGKMANPFWQPYVSNMVWSDNFNPEGYAEKASLKTGDISWFAVFMQMAANNNSNVSNQWMFGQQAGASTVFTNDSAVKTSVGYYLWNGADKTSLNPPNAQQGNTMSGTSLASRFAVGELMAEYTSKFLPHPLSIQASYIKNVHAQLGTKYDTGYHFGFIYGQAKESKTWECAYFYKMVQPDATVAAPVDTSFGPGGTNVKGHYMSFSYSPTKNVQFKTKYYITQPVIDSMSSYGNVNRLQVDASLSF